MYKKINLLKSGFTIVELLVVIVVIGILASITIVSYTGISQKATISVLQSDLSNASNQFRLYQATNSAYPTSLDGNNCFLPTSSDGLSYCLRLSNGNTFGSYERTVSTFKLILTKGSYSYKVSESYGPILATTYNLSLTSSGNGSVSGAGTYESGTSATITAIPNGGYQFSSWSGDAGCSGVASHTITMTVNTNCTATFTIVPLVLYEAGDEKSATTGGWTGHFTTCNIPAYYSAYLTATKAGSYFEAYNTTASRSINTLVTQNAIDLTNFTTLYVDIEVLQDNFANGGSVVGFSSSNTNWDTQFVAIPFIQTVSARQVYSVNVSSYNQSGYSFMGGAIDYNGTVQNRIYKIWLE